MWISGIPAARAAARRSRSSASSAVARAAMNANSSGPTGVLSLDMRARYRDHAAVPVSFEPAAAKARLLQLVRELAYRDGLDVVLASGKRSTFYIDGKKVSLHPEGL